MINIYNESSLHKTLKNFYSAQKGFREEVSEDGHIYDILSPDGSIIEIQTKNLSKLFPKIQDALSKGRRCKIVYPLVIQKEIILLKKDGTQISARKSPKKNSIYDLFSELTGIYPVLLDRNLSLEVLFITAQEIRTQTDCPVQSKNKKRRFKANWIKTDKKLKEIHETKIFYSKEDYIALLPQNLNEDFTVKDLEKCLKEIKGLPKTAAKNSSLIVWVLVRMNLITQTGTKGKARIYKINRQKSEIEQYGFFK